MIRNLESKKRILFVINSINFLMSHRIDLYKKLLEDGYQVHIVCGNEELKEEYKNKIEDIEYQSINLKKTETNPLKIIFAILNLIFIIFKRRPKIIHTVSPIGNLIGGIASLFFRKIFLITAISGRGTLYINKSLRTRIVKLFFSICEFIYLNKKKSASITQNLNDYQEIKSKQFKNKINIIIKGSGVDLEKFYPKSFKKKFDFCFIGRLTKEKGIYDFIEAARISNDKMKGLKFLVIGDMPSKNSIEYTCLQEHFREKEYISYIGFQLDIVNYYNYSKCLCIPSQREGMPRVVLEASACGVPSIAYDVVGCNEAISQNVNGFLVENKGSKHLSKMMLEIINKINFSEIKKKSRRHAEDNFSIESVLMSHINLYNQVLSIDINSFKPSDTE